MISSPQAINELLGTLLDGTRGGTIRWKAADARGRAFIARRPSGTVTLHGGADFTQPGSIRLIVKDRGGTTVEEMSASSMRAVISPVGVDSAFAAVESQLRLLYETVREQVQRSETTIRTLAEEFRR